MCKTCSVSRLALRKISGASPSEDRYYVLILFDISNSKKYRKLIKVLKKYSKRVQKSVFEAYIKPSQLKELLDSINHIMQMKNSFNPDDSVRIYKIASNCELVVYGEYKATIPEENIFF